jgi:hypothetical protein
MTRTVTLVGGPMHGLLRAVNHDDLAKGMLVYSTRGGIKRFYAPDKTNPRLWVWSHADLDLNTR